MLKVNDIVKINHKSWKHLNGRIGKVEMVYDLYRDKAGNLLYKEATVRLEDTSTVRMKINDLKVVG